MMPMPEEWILLWYTLYNYVNLFKKNHLLLKHWPVVFGIRSSRGQENILSPTVAGQQKRNKTISRNSAPTRASYPSISPYLQDKCDHKSATSATTECLQLVSHLFLIAVNWSFRSLYLSVDVSCLYRLYSGAAETSIIIIIIINNK